MSEVNETFLPEFLILPVIILDIIVAILAIPLEITVIGSIICDIIGAILSLLLKDWLGMVLSLLALIPVIGSAFSVAKIVFKGGKVAKYVVRGSRLI